MNEHEWEDLKRYLEEHGIEYSTELTFLSGYSSAFAVVLPLVYCEHNTPTVKNDEWPDVAEAWERMQKELKGVKKE